jgi:superfamily II DNA or RNA helicase
MTREELQKQARDAWYKNFCQGCISSGVGTGKSWIAIHIHNELWFKGIRVLLVTPTIILHEQNWKTEYEKAQCEILYQTLEDRVCYVSLGKYNPDDYDLIIFDEAHHISEANYEEFIKHIKLFTPQHLIKIISSFVVPFLNIESNSLFTAEIIIQPIEPLFKLIALINSRIYNK